MKAIQVERHGGPEVLQSVEIEVPAPKAGQVRIEIRAAGVNYIDTYHRTGLYPLETPFIPGQEAAGFVHAVGDGVEGLKVGDRVAYAPATGSYAQYRVISSDRVVPLPDTISFELAAAVMLQGMTAHYLAHDTVSLRRSHRVLIHAAAGGVGRLFVQIAKMRGATVYGTAGSVEKAEMAREAGADEVILYRETDFAERIRELTDGDGLDVVYDSVGRATFDQSLECLRPRGMLVSFGQASGPVEPLEIRRLSARSLYLTRPTLGHYIASRTDLLRRAADLFTWIGRNQLDVRIDSTFPLERTAEAHRRLESRVAAGKILLLP